MMKSFAGESLLPHTLLQQRINQELRNRGYRCLWKPLAVGLRWNFKDQTSSEIYFYFKPILFFIPLWYLGISVEASPAGSGQRVHFFYCTKGLEILDIFRIARRWQREQGNLREILH